MDVRSGHQTYILAWGCALVELTHNLPNRVVCNLWIHRMIAQSLNKISEFLAETHIGASRCVNSSPRRSSMLTDMCYREVRHSTLGPDVRLVSQTHILTLGWK